MDAFLKAFALDGYKSYVAGWGAILSGVGGLLSGTIPPGQAAQLIFGGLATIGIRHAMEKAKPVPGELLTAELRSSEPNPDLLPLNRQ